MTRYCFITGFLRSGTTLVEKLVHALPGACVGPQPFPFLYHDAKRAFLRARGLGEERYPLGHLFGEQRYRPEEFERFLAEHRLTREAVSASFTAMRGYSGWKLPALEAELAHVREGTFVEVFRQLCDRLARVLGREGSRVVGAKEVFCEEFIPYFLTQGVAVILVVRDVRDVLTSLKLGSGPTYVNRGMPVLHAVRQWRKSVAFALELAGTPGFDLVRYEDLVEGAGDWLDGLAQRFGLPPAGADAIADLRDQDGRLWESNSSFSPVRGVSRASVGRVADALPLEWVAALEAACAPEMRALGYAPAAGGDALADALARVARGADLVGPGQSLAEEIDAEVQRARLIAEGGADDAEQRRLCVFPRAYQRLAGR